MANAIGIDFGTTKTMVSWLNPATGKAELVRLGRDRDSIPTTVHVDQAGAFLFGEDADDQMEADPEGYCRAFKLHLGESDSIIPRAGATAEELARRFLRHVKEECEQNVFHGEPIDTATITVPVSFSPARMASLKRAAEAAGFAKVSFLPEPEAAGTAFLRDNPADKFSRALVLDWGGGTLDIAIISRDEDGTIHADSHCVEGRDDVGGEEIDRGLLVNLDAMWENAYDVLLSSEENEPKLLREAEKVKIGLSRKDVVPFWRAPKKIEVSRDFFNKIIVELVDAAINLVNSALAKNTKWGNPAPDAILLIGGTSQIPAVREAMEANFPQLRVLSWHHSHEAVALGATEVETNFAPSKRHQSGKEEIDERYLPDEVFDHADNMAGNYGLTKSDKSNLGIIGNVGMVGSLGATDTCLPLDNKFYAKHVTPMTQHGVKCWQCGADLRIGMNFCANCGAATTPLNPVATAMTNQMVSQRGSASRPTRLRGNKNMNTPVRQLTTSRGLGLWIVFTIISLGLYPLFALSNISSEINLIASARDGRHTMDGGIIGLIIAPITLGIAGLVWYNNLCDRIGNELAARNINYSFGVTTFWGWGVFGAFLFGLGPLFFIDKLCKAMNLLNADYNVNGPSQRMFA